LDYLFYEDIRANAPIRDLQHKKNIDKKEYTSKKEITYIPEIVMVIDL